MNQLELLTALKKLSVQERLDILEVIVRDLRTELGSSTPGDGVSAAWQERDAQLAAAARALLPDYTAGGELTAFTALDSEDFLAR